MNYQIGSCWKKWDLHVHTPLSIHNEFKFQDNAQSERYDKDIWKKYIEELEKISDISVIGITDYFSIEGYKKVLDYREIGGLSNIDLVLPNIEFRLDKYLSNRREESSKRLNYHVIFSDEIETDKIENEFLKTLNIKTAQGEERQLTEENLVEIGRVLKEQHENFRDKPDITVGCNNVTVSLDQIRKTLESKKSIFGGKYLLVLPEERWCLIDWDGQDHLMRKELLYNSHAIFSSNSKTREWALGQKHETQEDFIEEFGSLKPCLHGSDAHAFENLCKPEEDRFCWIKADTSFEGLKQIVFEPDERVIIQSENPELRKNIYSLNSLKIENSKISDDLEVKEQDIILNRNLVAIAGGKGSGKTALLDLMANCFEDRCKRSGESKNSFVQRIEDQKNDLKTSIAFIGESIDIFSKELIEEKFFEDSTITYLPQGKIEEYSGDRKRLDKKIKEIIFSNKKIVEKNYKEKFDTLKDEIIVLSKEIKTMNIKIFELEEETTEEIKKEIVGKRNIKQGVLKNKENELKELLKSIEKGIGDKTAKLKEEESTLRIRLSDLNECKESLESLKNSLSEDSIAYEEWIDSVNIRLSDLEISKAIPKIDFNPQIEVINNTIRLIDDYSKKVIKQIKAKEKELSQLSGVEKAQAAILKEIEQIDVEIKTLEKQLKDLKTKKDEIDKLEKERTPKYLELLKKYFEWKKYYEDIIETFSLGKSKIMEGIDFKSKIYFNHDEFIWQGVEILDMRSINIIDIEALEENLENIINQIELKDLTEKLEGFIGEIFKLKGIIKEKRTSYDFDEWVFKNYFSLSTEIFFKGTNIDKLSIGQKGTVLLKLFLAEGDQPLVVDQPEENLDNKFIYNELVSAFREAKKNRQVIIATNNANLVVNTDAEQVIVAEYENNKISYKCGSLENLKIRSNIIPILEGGEKAFREREEKYGM